jgi:hypothetical protein
MNDWTLSWRHREIDTLMAIIDVIVTAICSIKTDRARNIESAVAFQQGQVGCDLKRNEWRAGKSQIV